MLQLLCLPLFTEVPKSMEFSEVRTAPVQRLRDCFVEDVPPGRCALRPRRSTVRITTVCEGRSPILSARFTLVHPPTGPLCCKVVQSGCRGGFVAFPGPTPMRVPGWDRLPRGVILNFHNTFRMCSALWQLLPRRCSRRDSRGDHQVGTVAPGGLRWSAGGHCLSRPVRLPRLRSVLPVLAPGLCQGGLRAYAYSPARGARGAGSSCRDGHAQRRVDSACGDFGL